MKRFFIRGTLVIFGVFLFFSSALATSEVLFLGDQQKSIALGKQFLFLKDDTKNLTINNILSHKFESTALAFFSLLFAAATLFLSKLYLSSKAKVRKSV